MLCTSKCGISNTFVEFGARFHILSIVVQSSFDYNVRELWRVK
jgi:hypothetical protein